MNQLNLKVHQHLQYKDNMEAKNIIYGTLALAVIGGGAYFFLKNKKSKDASKLADLQNAISTIGTTTGSTTGSTTTPDKVLGSAPVVPQVPTIPQTTADPKKIADAIILASEIADLKNKKTSYTIMSLANFSKTKEGGNGFWSNSKSMLELLKKSAITDLDNKIKDLTNKIVALGYIEVNGSIVKVN